MLDPSDIFGDDLLVWLDADYEPSFTFNRDGNVGGWLSRWPICSYPCVYGVAARGRVQRLAAAPNGHFAVKTGLRDGQLSGDGPYANLVAVVAAYTNAPHAPGYLSGSNLVANMNGSEIRAHGTWELASFDVASARGGWNDGQFHSFGVHGVPGGPSSGGAFSVRTDGVVATVPSAPPDFAVPLDLGGLYVSFDGGATIEYPLEGYIAEVIVARMVGRGGMHVSDQEEQDRVCELSRYFQQKYGIPF